MRLLKIYFRTIDKQFINKQPSYIQEILECFLDDKNDHDKILCRGKKSNETAEIEIQLATDPRFSTALTTLLNKEDSRGCEIGDIMAMYKYPTEYVVELIKKDNEKYNSYLELFTEGNRHALLNVNELEDKEEVKKSFENDSKNVIYYGVPGCGKSFTINEQCGNDKNHMERIVFHPDYSYADFIGQILPSNIEGKISYPFKPGPFTKILKKAIDDDSNNYYLIIEEINRGNAPAIFGDIFQLLDRNSVGTSVYSINNEDISTYVYSDPNVEIRIPSNLFILATMNTADQNVFTLDTAFKRRWKLKCIENDINSCDFAENEICDTNVSWGEFVSKINSLIIEEGNKSLGSEDKRIGAWFIQKEDLQSKEAFSEKVLLYLWNDVFKYNQEVAFDIEQLTTEKTLENLIRKFKTIGLDIFNKENISFTRMMTSEIQDGNVLINEDYLSSKNPVMVNIFKDIEQRVKKEIPSLKAINTGYIQLRAEGHKKHSFADITIRKKQKMEISVQMPPNEVMDRLIQSEIGEEVGTEHHSHPFNITLVEPSDLNDDVIEAIVNSYKKLKIE